MNRRPAPSLRWAILLLLGCAVPAGAQTRRTTALGPAGAVYTSARAEAERIPALDRSIGVELEGASLEQALAQIATRTGLRLTYSTDLLPEDHRVSLHARSIPAADAVLRVLRGTSLDLLVSSSGHAVVVECSPATCGPRVKRPSARAVPAAGVSYAHRPATVARSARARRSRPEHRTSSVLS